MRVLFPMIGVLGWLGALASATDPVRADALLTPTARDAISAEILFLPEDTAGLDAAPSDDSQRLTITGAYSSGDRFAPEGFVIRNGDATHPWPQGWDGLLLIDGEGRLSLHDVSSVRVDNQVFNLRKKNRREPFLDLAAQQGFTAVQSHLLINEGALDLEPVEGARKFRRRLLFEMPDGRIGIWDTSPRMVTLYEAAAELNEAEAPRFALNLDMGAYDFCEKRTGAAEPERCGILTRSGLSKLTNLLTLTAPKP